mgnify:CR=1 FL=1|jgi:phosphoribosylanthranilate isomerase
MLIKICGMTRAEDAVAAVAAGATAVGFVFWPGSPRVVTPVAAAAIARIVPAQVQKVGVFVDATPEEIREVVRTVGLDVVQLHGAESAASAEALNVPVWKAFGVDERVDVLGWPGHMLVLLDAIDPRAKGGTGRTIDWGAAAELAGQRPVVLAGGLTPDNVGEAIGRVRPYGVDVSSGVEQAPGIKDHEKVQRFVAAARAGFERLRGATARREHA